MVNFKSSLFWVAFIFLSLGCQQEYVEPILSDYENIAVTAKKKIRDSSCTEYYYMYESTRVNLGEVNTAKIILGFKEGISPEQKAAFISKYPYLQSIQYDYNTGSGEATVVQLKDGLTCKQVETALAELLKQPEIRFANPFFQSPFDTNLLGIANQFIVNLKPGFTSKDLEKLTRRTKTQIVDQLGEQTFILSADKYSTGNALQLANEFAGFYPVASSEPDFLYDN